MVVGNRATMREKDAEAITLVEVSETNDSPPVWTMPTSIARRTQCWTLINSQRRQRERARPSRRLKSFGAARQLRWYPVSAVSKFA